MAKSKAKGNRFKSKVAKNTETQKQKQSAQYGHLRLPKGVNIFKEPPGGRVRLDFLPYEVTDLKHPDRDEDTGIATPGELWYKRPYFLHRNVGVDNNKAVCPSSVGSKCPVCEYRAKQLREGASYQSDEIKALKATQRNLYVVIPLREKDYEEVPHIWDISQYLFQDKLNEELEEDEENMGFPDLDDGLTVRVRFSEESFGKNTYAETSRIDFEDRDEQYGEDILEDVPNLDEVLDIPSYKDLERRFFELEEEDEADDDDGVIDDTKASDADDEDEVSARRRRRGKKAEPEDEEEEDDKPRRSRRSKKAEPEPEPEDDAGEEAEEPEEKPTRTRRKKSGKKAGKKAKDEDEESEDDECPHGYRFGVDTDQYDECDECTVWEACLDRKEAKES